MQESFENLLNNISSLQQISRGEDPQNIREMLIGLETHTGGTIEAYVEFMVLIKVFKEIAAICGTKQRLYILDIITQKYNEMKFEGVKNAPFAARIKRELGVLVSTYKKYAELEHSLQNRFLSSILKLIKFFTNKRDNRRSKKWEKAFKEIYNLTPYGFDYKHYRLDKQVQEIELIELEVRYPNKMTPKIAMEKLEAQGRKPATSLFAISEWLRKNQKEFRKSSDYMVAVGIQPRFSAPDYFRNCCPVFEGGRAQLSPRNRPFKSGTLWFVQK